MLCVLYEQKAEELRLKGIPDEQNAALKELERQTTTLRNYLLWIERARMDIYHIKTVKE